LISETKIFSAETFLWAACLIETHGVSFPKKVCAEMDCDLRGFGAVRSDEDEDDILCLVFYRS
jgi:hypothetical protein